MRTARPILTYLFCLAAFVWTLSTPAFAAEADAAPGEAGAAEADAAAGDANQVEDTSFIELLQQGGWPMIILGLLSTGGVGLIIYNLIAIREKAFLVPQVQAELKSKLESLDIEGARSLCEEKPSPVTNILLAGLDRVDEEQVDLPAMEKAMDEASTEELAAPFVMINYLSAVATLSPMVGLLGTVLGMVSAFRQISVAGMGQASELAGSIQMALITTAGGLTVAVPAMIAYLYFKNRYGRLVSGVSRSIGDLYHTLVQSVRSQQAA